MLGKELHGLLSRLFPICRSLTGNGNRLTLKLLREHIPLVLHEVPSGTKVFDWTVPDEWNCMGGWLARPDTDTVCDFKHSNLHIVGYSLPVEGDFTLAQLQPHLHSLPELPYAIPYVTSYYKRDWGFCLPHSTRENLHEGEYYAHIDATLEPGYLTYGDLVVEGDTDKEVMFSCYICHPSMANDSLSGVVVATALAKWILSLPRRRYTYRFVFIPETIGSLVYLSRHLAHLKAHVVAGYVLTCLGDERAWSLLYSRNSNTLADNIAWHVLFYNKIAFCKFNTYGWTERGSDERQWCAPGVDLPVASVMRSKYGTFPEYHTSMDNLDFVTPKGLEDSFKFYQSIVECLEANYGYRATCIGEPFLSQYGEYNPDSRAAPDLRLNVLSYADGHSLLDIANALSLPMHQLAPTVAFLLQHKLLEQT